MSVRKCLSAALCAFLVALTVCAGRTAPSADDSGECIGYATWSVEAFTIGGGFLVEPTELPIRAGETAADQLLRLLRQSGLVCYFGGTTRDAFYLAYIADGTSAKAKFNRYSGSGIPQNARELRLSPSIPAVLLPHLRDTMVFFDPDDYEKNWTGYLGEFVFTNGSGWMYAVNHAFPGVGFSDTFLSDGDVVRVQFTLAYGADIGGLGATGGNAPGVGERPTSGYYPVANKDALCKAICRALSSGSLSDGEVKSAYENALAVMETPDALQDSVNDAVRALDDALSKPSEPDEPPAADNSAMTSESSEPVESVGSDEVSVADGSGSTSEISESGNSDGTSVPSETSNSVSASAPPETSNPVSASAPPETNSPVSAGEISSAYGADGAVNGQSGADGIPSVADGNTGENSAVSPVWLVGVAVLPTAAVAALLAAYFRAKKGKTTKKRTKGGDSK